MSLMNRILQGEILLLDGAIGTRLAASGLEPGGHVSLSHPEVVAAVHRAYVEAGSALITTNTIGLETLSAATDGRGIDIEAANQAAVALARSAARPGQYVLGGLASTGQLIEPYGDCPEELLYRAFRGQAEVLAASGVDGFIVETMIDLREALCAVRACRDVSALPVLATLSFQTPDNGGRTPMGDTAREAGVALVREGATAVGANCGDLTPGEMSTVIRAMANAVDCPLVAQPNAGKPHLVDGKTVFTLSPGAFAEGVRQCVSAGATIVGGCCGTTPAHISAVAQSVIDRR